MARRLLATVAAACACLLCPRAAGERIQSRRELEILQADNTEVAGGAGDAVFLGRHNLWTDSVVFQQDSTFHRQSYPQDEHGTWAVRGKILMMVWEGWGQVELLSEDGGQNFYKLGFWLEAESVPAWWTALFRAEASKAPPRPRTADAVWAEKYMLPENEGYAISSFPTLTTVEQCRHWCDGIGECIGFAADVKDGVVKSWAPVQMKTGFDPESAEWLNNKRAGEGEQQFHWKADDESLRHNDDGSTRLLRCPPGLHQHPEFNYLCQGEDGISFNKDGTINMERLMLQEMSAVWTHFGHPPGEHTPTFLEEVQDYLVEKAVDKTKGALIGAGLAAATALASKGTAVYAIAHIVAKSYLVWGHLNAGPLVPLSALVAYYKYLDDWRWAMIASQKRVAGLLFKSRCMREVSWTDGTLQRAHLRAEIDECPGPLGDTLMKQLPRTLNSMTRMFSVIEDIAWCMRGGAEGLGEGWKDGVSCSEEVLTAFRGTNGRPGLLTAALMATTTYAQLTDALFKEGKEPSIKGHLRVAFLSVSDYSEMFKVKVPPALDAFPTLNPEEKEMTCTNLLVTQVSYERIFTHLSGAFPLWMRTFGLDDATRWFSSPCRGLFNDMADPSAPMCLEPGSRGYLGSGSTCSKGRDVNLFQEK